jgi:hypothetical protein
VPDVLFVVAPVLLFAAYTIFILLNEITKAAKTASPLSDFIKTISFLEALPPNLRKPLKRLDLNFYVPKNYDFRGIIPNPTPPYSILKLH